LLLQGGVEKPRGVIEAELGGPALQRAVAGDLVMLDRLRGGDQAGVEGRRVLELVHDLLAFGDDALDGVAGLAARRLADDVEHLLETFEMALGLLAMLLEGRFQLGGLRRALHLRQRLQNLPLRVIDVLKGFMEQVVQRLFPCGHGRRLLFREGDWLPPENQLPRRLFPAGNPTTGSPVIGAATEGRSLAAKMRRSRSGASRATRDFGRAAGGALLFSLPMLMTMELWQLGFYLGPARLLALLVSALPLLVFLSRYIGFERTRGWRDDVLDALIALGTAAVV